MKAFRDFGKKLALSLLLSSAALSGAQASEARVNAFSTTTQVHVESYMAKKFASVVHQKYDFSCGSAALATLLSYHYDRHVSEEQVFDAMWAVGDQKNIRAKGFSLLDMKLYLASVGLQSDGFRLSLDKLREVSVPAIALIVRKGYAHFVVLRGIAKDYVVLGDPALGSITVSRKEFESGWNGIAFLVRNDAQVARAHFNLKRDLPVMVRAEPGSMMSSEALANITVLMRASNEL